jgi:hypothetical protein
MRTVVALDAVRNAHWSQMPPDPDDGMPIDPLAILIRRELIVAFVVDKADSMSFVPGTPKIFIEDGIPKLNIWVPPVIVPMPGNITPFVNHLVYLFDGHLPAINWFCDWLAHVVQRPAVKSTAPS